MQPNPLLKKLGLANDDRAVIIHADDIGMCQASLSAYSDLVDFGLISAASVMVPCSWFPATAAFCRGNEQVDMGVHVTLTSEGENCRWGPMSTREPASGLLDPAGYFHADDPAVHEHGDPDAVQREIQAQVERALQAGIDVTHIDTHRGTVLHPKFLGAYIQTALQHRIPPFMLRKDEAGLRALGLQAQGLPLLDKVIVMPLDQPQDRLEQVKHTLDNLEAGLTYLIIHPAQDTPELRAIVPYWPACVADYQTFSSEALRAHIQASGITVIGYRALRDLLPA